MHVASNSIVLTVLLILMHISVKYIHNLLMESFQKGVSVETTETLLDPPLLH